MKEEGNDPSINAHDDSFGVAGDPLSDDQMALLFVEAMQSEQRFHFFDAKYEPAEMPQRAESILLISLSNIGDVVCASAAFNGLREMYPSANVVFLTEEPSGALFKGNPDIDRVIEYSKKKISKDFDDNPGPETLSAACDRSLELLRELRTENFDLALNLHASSRSALIAGAAVDGKMSRFGFSVGRDGAAVIRGNIWMLQRLKGKIPSVRAPEENNIRSLGLAPSTRKGGVNVARSAAADWFAGGAPPTSGRTVGINPFASVLEREWGLEKYIQLCRILAQDMDCAPVLFAGPGGRERDGAKRILEEAGVGMVNCIGGPPDRTAWFASRCDLFITNDTGPMHIAGATGTRCLAIQGPATLMPYSSIGHVGMSAAIPCAGCDSFPNCEKRECFELITPDQVAHVAAIMLENQPAAALSKLAGNLNDGGFPHGLITTGTYESLTPRYIIRLRSAMPFESSIVSELARIAVFNVSMLIEGGSLETGQHPHGADHPGLAATFLPETALREVLRRHDFAKYDIIEVKKTLEEIIESRNARIETLSPVTIVVLLPFFAFRNFLFAAGMPELHARTDALCGEFLAGVLRNI